MAKAPRTYENRKLQMLNVLKVLCSERGVGAGGYSHRNNGRKRVSWRINAMRIFIPPVLCCWRWKKRGKSVAPIAVLIILYVGIFIPSTHLSKKSNMAFLFFIDYIFFVKNH